MKNKRTLKKSFRKKIIFSKILFNIEKDLITINDPLRS